MNPTGVPGSFLDPDTNDERLKHPVIPPTIKMLQNTRPVSALRLLYVC